MYVVSYVKFCCNFSALLSCILFLEDFTDIALVYLDIACKPCFTVRFTDQNNDVPERCELEHISHRYLRILALGTLLLNIGSPIFNQDSKRKLYTPQERINTDCTWGQQVKGDASWPSIGSRDTAGDELRGLYRRATLACFDKGLLAPTNLSVHVIGKSIAGCSYHSSSG